MVVVLIDSNHRVQRHSPLFIRSVDDALVPTIDIRSGVYLSTGVKQCPHTVVRTTDTPQPPLVLKSIAVQYLL